MIDKKGLSPTNKIRRSTPRRSTQSVQDCKKNHLLNIPFENLDIHYGKTIILDPLRLQQKNPAYSKGGDFCYELNGLFYHLLWQLGFDVQMISARVNDGQGNYGPPFDHMALVVRLEEPWLIDVGFWWILHSHPYA